MLKCPRCGQRLEIATPTLTFRQRRILRALETLERDHGGPVATKWLVPEIGVSPATLKNELSHLEHMRRVFRPNGVKSGWALCAEEPVIQLVMALSA